MNESGKVCNRCGEFKSYEDFHKDRTQKDGYKKLCKPCRSGVQREYRSNKSEQEDQEERLVSEARLMAIKYLIENHKQEYLVLFTRAKNKLGIKPKWIKIN